MKVLGYFIGFLILIGFVVVIVNSIRSFVEFVRARRDKRKSPETASSDHPAGDVDDDTGKEVPKDK